MLEAGMIIGSFIIGCLVGMYVLRKAEDEWDAARNSAEVAEKAGGEWNEDLARYFRECGVRSRPRRRRWWPRWNRSDCLIEKSEWEAADRKARKKFWAHVDAQIEKIEAQAKPDQMKDVRISFPGGGLLEIKIDRKEEQ